LYRMSPVGVVQVLGTRMVCVLVVPFGFVQFFLTWMK